MCQFPIILKSNDSWDLMEHLLAFPAESMIDYDMATTGRWNYKCHEYQWSTYVHKGVCMHVCECVTTTATATAATGTKFQLKLQQE